MTGSYDLVDHIAGILPAYCRLTANMMTQLHWALAILGQNLGRWCDRHVSIGWSSAWLRARLVNKLSFETGGPRRVGQSWSELVRVGQSWSELVTDKIHAPRLVWPCRQGPWAGAQ